MTSAATGEGGAEPVDAGRADGGAIAFAQLDNSAAVKRWLEGPSFVGAPASERTRALGLLAALCEFTGKDPDAIVAGCVRTTEDGERAISAKGRRSAERDIEACVATLGLEGHPAIVAANTLRGFLIHNGIFMQGPASIR